MKLQSTAALIIATAVATLVSIPMSAASALYFKIEGVPGESHDKQKDQIDISSWSFGASQPGAGSTTGTVKFQVDGIPRAALIQLCQSRARLTTVVADLDGVKHTFQNASFDGCQTGTGTVPTDQFSLNYAKCATHGTTHGTTHAPAGTLQNAPRPNAKLTGLGPTPTPVFLESLTLNGSGAMMTLTKVGAGTLTLADANQKLPSLIVEVTNGQKWTFYRVIFEKVVIPSATGQPTADRPSENIALNFEKVEGPRTGFQAGR